MGVPTKPTSSSFTAQRELFFSSVLDGNVSVVKEMLDGGTLQRGSVRHDTMKNRIPMKIPSDKNARNSLGLFAI
jgi:hypothetical protein